MKPIQPTRRRRSWLSTVAAVAVMLLAGGAAAVAGLWCLGIDLPFLSQREVGLRVSIPVNARPIAAYERVTREHLYDPESRSFASMRLRPDQVIGMPIEGADATGKAVSSHVRAVRDEQGAPVFVLADGSELPLSRTQSLGGALMHPGLIMGRVVRSDKRPNYGFKESSFFPRGTPPGVAGATPPGKRALTLQVSKLVGAHALRLGDHVELVANVPIDNLAAFDRAFSSSLPARRDNSPLLTNSRSRADQQTEARSVALDAVVLKPVIRRLSPQTSSSLTQGKRVTQVPIEEIVLAVDEDDAPRVTEALTLGATINCFVHSGRPADSEAAAPPAGMVAAPVVGRPVTAYRPISSDHLENIKTRRRRHEYVRVDEAAERGVITDATRLIGRVAARDKGAGELFFEHDLLPIGTPPGVAAAIPPGKRLFYLDAQRLTGADSLDFRQRVDLVASTPVELSKLAGRSRGSTVVTAAGLSNKPYRVETVVWDGVVIMPVKSLANAGANSAQRGKTNAGRRLILAVTPAEAAALREKISQGAEFSVVTRGVGQPTIDAASNQADAPPTIDPLRGATTIETISGRQRQRLIFLPDGSPIAVAPEAAQPNASAAEARPEPAVVRASGN